jgi:hypothetical protein
MLAMAARISPSLEKRMRAVPEDEPVDVVVELTPRDLTSDDALGAHDKVEWMKARFAAQSEPICAVVDAVGGRVNEGLWLDETLRVSVPRHSITKLAHVEGVHALDVARALSRDSSS